MPETNSITDAGESRPSVEFAALSDLGTNRENNEDAIGHSREPDGVVIVAIADGVGGYEGGEVASAMAIETTLAAYRDAAPVADPGRVLSRAVQRANIEIHNRALAVPELRRMATTLTVVAIKEGTLYGAHVGDCRLYLVRGGQARQITKDHTVVAERTRMGLMSAAQARNHPDRSALSRCLGHDLIASIDRFTMPLANHDRLILCTDGLYNVFEDRELEALTRDLEPQAACAQLINHAIQRGTADNLTSAVLVIHAGALAAPPLPTWRERLTGWLGRKA